MPDLSSALRELIDGSLSPVDVDAIVGARRRRRLRRRAGSAVVVVVIATLVVGGVLARPVHEPKTLTVQPEGGVEAEATRAVLRDLTILSPGGPTFRPNTDSQVRNMNLASHAVNVTDPLSGETSHVSFPVLPNDTVFASVDAAVVRGSNILMLVTFRADKSDLSQRAFVVTSTLDRWKEIGPTAITRAFPSQNPDRAWVADAGSVAELGFDSGSGWVSSQLTDQREPQAAVTGGLVTLRKATDSYVMIIEVWDPATNRVLRTFPTPAQLVAASGDFVVWSTNPGCLATCPRHILDLRSGNERLVAVPEHMEWDSEAQFAPDGRHVGLVAHDPLPLDEKGMRDIPAPGRYRSTVLVVDGSSGDVAEHTVTTWKGRTRLMWSPDSSLLFVARDDEHLDYLNTKFENSPMRELTVPRADAALVVAKPMLSAETQKYEYDGLVKQSRHHSPELCIYPTAAIGGPNAEDCAGPLIAGWDLPTTSGTFHLVGTYAGDVFTLTEPPRVSGPISPGRPPIIASPCETPPGGWQPSNSSLVTLDAYTAVMDAARAAPDFAGIWFGPNAFTGGVTDLSHSVINVAYTGNLDAHRTALAQIWGGPICVVQHPHSYAELQRISQELLGAAGRQLGLQLLSVGPDEVDNVVKAEVVAATDETRQAVEQRFGKGVVVLDSRLTPVP